MKRLALLMLILALFAPRMTWAAHLSHHEPIAEASEVHVHHAQHAHHAADVDAAQDHDSDSSHEDGTDGLAHSHGPSMLVPFAALLPGLALIEPILHSEQLGLASVSDGIGLPPPKLPHRPPRRA